MELWGWLIGYIVLFALIHLLLYYIYVRRGDGTGSVAAVSESNHAGVQSAPGADQYRRRPTSDEHDLVELEGETISCPYCGAPNETDRTFTYCRLCISPLRQ